MVEECIFNPEVICSIPVIGKRRNLFFRLFLLCCALTNHCSLCLSSASTAEPGIGKRQDLFFTPFFGHVVP